MHRWHNFTPNLMPHACKTESEPASERASEREREREGETERERESDRERENYNSWWNNWPKRMRERERAATIGGIIDPVQLKRGLTTGAFILAKTGIWHKTFLPSGKRRFKAKTDPRKGRAVFQSLSSKFLLNWTSSVFHSWGVAIEYDFS